MFLGFAPLTAVMIVVMSLLDDVPIMAIACDNTAVGAKPIRWKMPRLLGVAATLGLLSVARSFGMLLLGAHGLQDPVMRALIDVNAIDELQDMKLGVPPVRVDLKAVAAKYHAAARQAGRAAESAAAGGGKKAGRKAAKMAARQDGGTAAKGQPSRKPESLAGRKNKGRKGKMEEQVKAATKNTTHDAGKEGAAAAATG